MMTKLTNPTLEKQQRITQPSKYTLVWRQQQLLVSLAQQRQQPYMPVLENERSLLECLKRSPARLVRLDPNLGDAKLRLWADACQQANKPAYLRIPSASELPGKRNPFSWWLKRLIDWMGAALLLLVLSPLMLGLVLLMRYYSPKPMFVWEWRVGERGKLFRIFQFRTVANEADNYPIALKLWMRKYKLNKLPQLFNVLRGEMSLVGPRPSSLYDAARVGLQGQRRLNALPGIIGDWQVQATLKLLDLDALTHHELEYLRSWSLWRDLKVLPLAMLKVISGFSAY